MQFVAVGRCHAIEGIAHFCRFYSGFEAVIKDGRIADLRLGFNIPYALECGPLRSRLGGFGRTRTTDENDQ